MFYQVLIRPLLFLLPPEVAHQCSMAVLRFLSRVPGLCSMLLRPISRGSRDVSLEVTAFGRRFPNPIGLAAGLDKDAEAYEALFALGFGFVEVGTITAHPQSGNPRPRLFRLPADHALINRMGFNNRGAEAAAAHIASQRRHGGILGINIGKTKVTPAEQAIEDYVASARVLGPLADYLVVNVSSPNTPGLRDLQAVEQLRPLLTRVRQQADDVSNRHVPLLVKIAPDLSDADIDAVADLALEVGVDGIIATNTTVSREGLKTKMEDVTRCGAGGLSGPVLKARSLAVLRRLRARVGNRVTLISVGGIETANDVYERLAAGAYLVQLYTGFIYGGPALPARLCRDLRRRLHAEGLFSVRDLSDRQAEGVDGEAS